MYIYIPDNISRVGVAVEETYLKKLGKETFLPYSNALCNLFRRTLVYVMVFISVCVYVCMYACVHACEYVGACI
jgi:hypothetical protein